MYETMRRGLTHLNYGTTRRGLTHLNHQDFADRVAFRHFSATQVVYRMLVTAQRAQRAQHVNLLLHRVLTALFHRMDAALFSAMLGGALARLALLEIEPERLLRGRFETAKIQS